MEVSGVLVMYLVQKTSRTSALRRVDMPTAALRQSAVRPNELRSASVRLSINFNLSNTSREIGRFYILGAYLALFHPAQAQDHIYTLAPYARLATGCTLVFGA